MQSTTRYRLLLPVLLLLALPGTNTHARISDWRITLMSGVVMSKASLDSLHGNALFISQHDNYSSIPLDSIAEMRRVTPSYWWAGMLVGGAIGGIVGWNYPTPSRGHEDWPSVRNATSLGFGGALLGGIIGGLLSIDRVYHLDTMTTVDRALLVQRLMVEG